MRSCLKFDLHPCIVLLIFGANVEKAADSNRIRQLTDILEVDVKPELITRLGIRDENRSRPIKLKMEKIDHKDQIMNSLSKLKQAPEGFKSISVTEYYTLEERQAIKDKVMEAINKTEKEGVCVNTCGRSVARQKTG